MNRSDIPVKAWLRRDDNLLLHVVLFLVVGYALISIFVLTAADTSFDQGVTLRLQRYQSPALDGFMEFISWWASIPGAAVAIIATSLLFALRGRYLEVPFLFSVLLVVPIVSFVKNLFGRERPTAEVVRVVRDFNNASFPSGHVVFYTVLFGFIAYLMYRHTSLPLLLRQVLGGFSIFLVFTVGFSRMYLGAHWFTDVSAGFILGLLLLIALVLIYNRAWRNRLAPSGSE